MRPLFLLSLPRAGSTFVQRVLAAHDEVATVSEPWVLLPLLYAERRAGARAEYGHVAGAEALDDFRRALPRGPAAYREELREFVLRLYEGMTPDGATYFLDKTPRYHFVAEELPALFPDARFVFLWRNPLAVLASFLDTFRVGRFEPHLFEDDLVRGPAHLVAARRAAGDRALVARYEDLVGPAGAGEWRRLFEGLGLAYDPGVLERFAGVGLRGRYGDVTGIRRYDRPSADPSERWRSALRGPVRRAWCARWLERIDEPLREMGYDPDELREGLDGRGTAAAAARDAVHLCTGLAQARARRAVLRIDDGPQPLGDTFGRDPSLLRRAVRRGLRRVRVMA